MTTAIAVHEVENGEVWAKAWRKGAGSRHEMFAKLGVTARNFRDPENPNLAMREDGLKIDTMRVLTEFTP